MYEIWFSNSAGPLSDEDWMCQCPDFHTAMIVFHALARKYPHVVVYDARGREVREVRKHHNF